MSFDIVPFSLAADLATAGTVTVGYPTGRSKGNYTTGPGNHSLVAGHTVYNSPVDFEMAFNANASNMTLTYHGSMTLKAGTPCSLQLDRRGQNDGYQYKSVGADGGVNMQPSPDFFVDLGSPNAAVTTAVTTAQLKGAAGNLTLDGTLVAAGVATFDVPRCVTLTVATTNQSGVNFTITGTDQYGQAMTEKLAGPNANTVSGNKAFKTVSAVANDAAIATNGVSVGTGTKLGLPCFLSSVQQVIKEMQDGAAPTAGTTVAGVLTLPTNQTGDVRGTYTPNAAPDGSKGFVLIISTPDPNNRGAKNA